MNKLKVFFLGIFDKIKKLPCWKLSLIVIIALILLGVIVIFVCMKETTNKIDSRIYGHYQSENLFMILEENGHCTTGIIGEEESNLVCNWQYLGLLDENGEISDKGIIPVAVIEVTDGKSSIKLKVLFSENYTSFIDSENERMNVYTKIKDINGNLIDESYSEKEEKKLLNTSKNYPVVTLTSGKKAYIKFKENGKCEPNFKEMTNSGKLSSNNETWHVIYQQNEEPCTYKIDDNIISVDWLGTYEEVYEFKLGTGQLQSSVVGEYYIMKGIKFRYDSETDSIEAINGKWDIRSAGNYFVLEFIQKNDENSSDVENNPDHEKETGNPDNDFSGNENSSDQEKEPSNSNNGFDDNKNNSNNNSQNNEKEAIKEALDNIYIEYAGIYGSVWISISAPNSIYRVNEILKSYKINDKEYAINSNQNQFIFEHAGKNCFQIQLIDINGNVRKEEKCIDFVPESPSFRINYSGCSFSLQGGGLTDNYNSFNQVQIYIDDVLLKDSPIIQNQVKILVGSTYDMYTVAGEHTIRMTNRYGLSTSKTFTAGSNCKLQ